MDAARARKLGDRIARIVADMLERRVKDPRLGFVTVTAAKITNDLREATVFYTVYGSPEERAETAAALASATGLIRAEVGHQTGLKHTPSLAFVADSVPDGARRMEDLVAKARAADAKLATVREGAVPAGDPDPYRTAPEPDGTDLDDTDADDTEPDDADPNDIDEGDLLGGSPGGGQRGAGYSPA
jgi:ribosome-binding factor A